ncbi:hypothetical protein ACHAPJ_010266 [Fusarium lateritium]
MQRYGGIIDGLIQDCYNYYRDAEVEMEEDWDIWNRDLQLADFESTYEGPSRPDSASWYGLCRTTCHAVVDPEYRCAEHKAALGAVVPASQEQGLDGDTQGSVLTRALAPELACIEYQSGRTS